MPDRIRRVRWSGPVEAGPVEPGEEPVLDTRLEIVEEWRAEPPVEEWTAWAPVGTVEDRDPTYYATHNSDGGPFRTPTLRALEPIRQVRTVWERRLVRRWVDPDRGPLAEVVRTETATGAPPR